MDGYLRYKWRFKDEANPANFDHADNRRTMRSAMTLDPTTSFGPGWD